MLGKTIFSTLNFLPWWVLLISVIIELALKGFALYRAARNEQKYWFIAILIVNSIGILPLIYLLLNPKKKGNKKA
jgi:hypothetical protein